MWSKDSNLDKYLNLAGREKCNIFMKMFFRTCYLKKSGPFQDYSGPSLKISTFQVLIKIKSIFRTFQDLWEPCFIPIALETLSAMNIEALELIV
jgi:hypothetical protein